MVLTFYFCVLGTFSVAHTLAPFLAKALPRSLAGKTFSFDLPKVIWGITSGQANGSCNDACSCHG